MLMAELNSINSSYCYNINQIKNITLRIILYFKIHLLHKIKWYLLTSKHI